MNEYERICKEWLKGCTCSSPGAQEECEECTRAFHSALRDTARSEGYKMDSQTIREMNNEKKNRDSRRTD